MQFVFIENCFSLSSSFVTESDARQAAEQQNELGKWNQQKPATRQNQTNWKQATKEIELQKENDEEKKPSNSI